MSFDFWGISVHHALGGRPLLLVVNGHKNGSEAQANASIAGHRLNRVMGGASGHMTLDSAWSAYFTRCNEAVIVATYLTNADPTEALRSAEASRAAVMEICGGKLSDVTLHALAKLNVEVQLAVRRAMSGFGCLRGIGTQAQKGKGSDINMIILSPDQPADDPTSVSIRAANDVTHPGRGAALSELYQQSSSKGDAFIDGVKGIRVPASAVESPAALSVLQQDDGAVTSTIRCARSSRPHLHFLPRVSAASVSLPPSPVRDVMAQKGKGSGDGQDSEQGEGSDGEGGGGGAVSMNDFLWTPSAEAAAAASGTDIVEFDIDFPEPPPPVLPKESIVLRIAVQASESVTLSSKAGGSDSAGIEGSAALKYMYGAALSPAVQDSGHGPVPFVLSMRTAGPLASLSFTEAGAGKPQAVHLQQSTDGPWLYTIQLTLPSRPPNLQRNPACNLASITYKYALSVCPEVVKASASCKLTFGPPVADGAAPAGAQQHRYTDVILRSVLAPGIATPAAQVQLLIPLPAPPCPAGMHDLPTYQNPLAKPTAQFSTTAGKSQLLWALSDIEGGDGGGPDVPSVAAFFAPAQQAEFKARVPLLNGLVTTEPSQHGAIIQLPLQLRFSLPTGSVAPIVLASPSAAGSNNGSGSTSGSTEERERSAGLQPTSVDGGVSGHELSVHVAAVLMKASSQR